LKYIRDIWNYSSELLAKSDVSSLTVKDVLGFEVPKGANAFLPHTKCVPISALFPLYDMLTVGISKIKTKSQIHDYTGLTFDDIVTLAHKKKLVLFIDVGCIGCLQDMSAVVYDFVDNDVPLFFAGPQETLLALKAAETVGVDLKDAKNIEFEYSDLIETSRTRKMRKEIHELVKRFPLLADSRGYVEIKETVYPLEICSKIKPTAKYLREVIDVGRRGASREYLKALVERLYMVPKFLLSKVLNSALCSNGGCKFLYEIGPFRSSLRNLEPPHYFDPAKLEFIEKKLRIAYSEQIPLAEYAEVFDSKTSGALRNIVKTIMSKGTGWRTSFVELQSLVNEYNETVNELISRKTTRAKIVYATSDILRSNMDAIKMLMMGVSEKYLNVPQKAWDCIGLPRRYRLSALRWLKEKALKLESQLVGVSPEIIHLYHTRTCLEESQRIQKFQS